MSNILQESKLITIGGKDYKLRRLNTRDVIKFATILGAVFRNGIPKLEEGQDSSQRISSLLLTALPLAEDKIIVFLADLIGLTVEEFDKLPPDALLVLIEELSASEDIKSFLDKAKTLLSKMGTLKQA